MLYYRVAFRVEKDVSVNVNAIADNSVGEQKQTQVVESLAAWKWRSTLLSSPHALSTLLRAYSYIPKENIRVFFASSEGEMNEMLSRQNQGTISSSMPAEQFLAGKSMNSLDVKRLELELSTLPDHDEPYTFAFPLSMPERTAWMRLMEKVQAGELADEL